MASYSSTTGNISLYAGDPWQAVTFPAITIASGEAFYRFKVTKSNTLSGIEIQNNAKSQTLSFDTWYTDYSYIGSSLSAPKINARNTASAMRTTTFTLTVETNVTTRSITVNAGTGGTASASVSSATPGTTVTITSSPNTGYSANTPTSNVSGVTFTSAGANKWTFTMPNSDITVTCNFTHVSYTITVGVSPSGSGSLSANKSSAYYNDAVQLTRSATAGWQFSSWTKSPTGLVIGNDLKFTMPASNVSVTAVFSKINYTVSVGSSPAAGGTVTTNKATAQVGDTVTLTKTAASGYQFSSWSTSPAGLSINSSNQFTMPAGNVSITANWSKINYNVTTSVSSGSGTLSTNKSTAQIGDIVTITASPSAGYSAGTPSATGITFTSAGTNKWTFTMPAGAVAVSISFSKITYTITKAVSPSGAGTVTAAATGQVGDQISVSQTPAAGYYFNGWTFSPAGPSVSGGKFSMPPNNVTVTANYLKRSTASVNTSSLTGGGSVTLTIVPDKTTYSHKYKLSFGTNMETSLTNVAAGTTSVTISVPESWSNSIPSSASKTGGTLLVETYSGNTKIGDYTITGLTYNVPGSAVPSVGTITTSIIRTIGGTTYADVGNYYVQGKCGVRVQASGSGALSSTISKIEVTISGYSDNGHKTTVNAGSVDWTSGLLTVSGTATISVKVTDSRSRTATSTKNITVTAYNRPSGTLTVYRVDNAGNTDPLGTYAKYSLTKAYTAVGSNSLSWSLTSQNVTASSPSDSGNILPSGRQSFSQTQEYTISLTLADAFETVTIQVTLPTAQFMFFFNATGDRLAFMKATNESLSKNGKNGTIEFSANHQIYIGNQKLEDAYIQKIESPLYQASGAHTITFSGEAITRNLAGVIVLCGQSGISEFIPFMFAGTGINTKSQITSVCIGPTTSGITASGNVITIPAALKGGWGTIEVLMMREEPDMTMTFA